ncbi:MULTISPECIES: hypothetical protein [Burkholderiaceae]|nr:MULTISPECIES: hypothetical protein [Burkholderiaceae]
MIDKVFKEAGGRGSQHRLVAAARVTKRPAAITTACEVGAR